MNRRDFFRAAAGGVAGLLGISLARPPRVTSITWGEFKVYHIRGEWFREKPLVTDNQIAREV